MRTPADPKLIVVAHDIRSLANVGALFRTCDGAGVSELVLSGYTGTPPDRRIDKVALGAVEMVPWRHAPGIDDLDAVLADRYVVVLEQHPAAISPRELSVPVGRDVVLVACEELHGARDWLVERASVLLELPMRGGKDSLNVAVAAGIAMYQVADQMYGTAPADLASRQDRPPVRDGVLTRGVTHGQQPDEVPPPALGTRLDA
jgi:23S rRNA (guanosine2251-2'-O)-methyltransferase